ncbi:MAG: zinc-binding dehydrogenase, partial [Gammaproteobacteria bacterium]|nr:zinc-binding dehydrogenase [Gammaproteobacteria bacterium]
HVLETAGGATLGQSLQALAQGGHVAYIGVMEGAGFSGSGFDLITKRARVQGVSVGHRRALQDLVRAADAGGLQPVVAARYPASQLHEALAHLAHGPLGKVVVTFAA